MIERLRRQSGMTLEGKSILITGSARRVGRILALACAEAGATIMLHHGHSAAAAQDTAAEIRALGGQAHILSADLNDPAAWSQLVADANALQPLYALVNSAAIFEPAQWDTTNYLAWQRHIQINLTAPFFLSQAFARVNSSADDRRIVNILDWRALRPGADHFPYTISKAALAALTQGLAVALAPHIVVNGLALGAILAPSDGAKDADILKHIPAQRWAKNEELGATLRFLLDGPAYINGEILHLDGGRHLI
jgi:NAD(P)-dependent dehydrogenase (short-subunit alcohol dehydrogenase family)